MKSFSLLACLTSSLFAQDTLKDKLTARSEASAKTAPAEVRSEFAKGIEVVKKSGIEKSAKQVGDKAPDFTLKVFLVWAYRKNFAGVFAAPQE